MEKPNRNTPEWENDKKERERKVLMTQIAIIAAAAAVALFILFSNYSVQPIIIYELPAASPSAAPLAVVSESYGAAEDTRATQPQAEASDHDVSMVNDAEVLTEKSINLNTASAGELEKLPGIGPALARRIVDYREANNGFYDIEELMMVSGIGEKKFAAVEPYIFTD